MVRGQTPLVLLSSEKPERRTSSHMPIRWHSRLPALSQRSSGYTTGVRALVAVRHLATGQEMGTRIQKSS